MVAEAIRLQVGEAPESIAYIGLAARRIAVGAHGLVGPAERFQRMAQHDTQVIAPRGLRPRALREEFAEDRDRVVVASEARERRGAKKAGLRIGRRGPQPLVDLLERRRILLALDQNAYE